MFRNNLAGNDRGQYSRLLHISIYGRQSYPAPGAVQCQHTLFQAINILPKTFQHAHLPNNLETSHAKTLQARSSIMSLYKILPMSIFIINFFRAGCYPEFNCISSLSRVFKGNV